MADEINKSATAARYDKIYITHGVKQGVGCFTVCRQQLSYMCVELMLFQYAVNNAYNGFVGEFGITSAFQQTSISTLKTKGKYVEAHVGASFVDDTDHAEGHTDFGELHAVGPHCLCQYPSQRRG
ncbi:hypothetical protein SDC9_190231 [bioreactor metagenome]|uniref:Uncharacterized protein n=1 Tax=bioreactor metagenome TaxID=1076179 RepID=A0A645I2R5_9ZZZZ